MKKTIIALLLLCSALSAQDHLKNFRNKTAKQIANVSHLLRMDTTFFHVRIGEKGRDLAAAIEARGLTPRDFATIKAALDTSIFRQNRLIFPPGTFTVDSLGIYDPITLSGVGIRRIKPGETTYYGSIIKSTNTTGLSLLKVLESGVFLHDLSLEGTKTDGHGFYSQRQPVSGSVNTTLGGYGLARVNSYNHGGSGFYIVGSDGNIFDELESFDNRGYGVVITSPEEAGLVNAGITAAGTTSLFRGGRSRRNKLGGWLISDQTAVGLHHIEAISDTSIGVWFDAGRSRSYMLGTDVEMQIPALTSTPLTTGVRVEDMNGFLMAQNFIGTQHAPGTTYTADSGTNTTTIVDAALANYGPDGYLIGWDVVNSTRSSGEVKITGYTASTGTLTLTSAISGQTTGDSYTISKDQNVGLRLHNLTSGVFMNNTFGINVDTMIATVGDGGALFVNNINFDPEDNLKSISGTFKWLYINTANVDSLSGGANTILMKTNKDFIIQSLDSLLLRSTGSEKGIEIDAVGKVSIQPQASGGVHLFNQVGDGENPNFRIYYDADASGGSTSLKYYDFAGSSTNSNIFSIKNVDSTQTLSFGTPVRFSGTTSERYFDIQNSPAGVAFTSPASGFIRFKARGDTAFVINSSGVVRSLYAGSGLGDVVGPASSTNNALVRFDGTTGKLVKNTSALTLSDAGAFSFADGVTQTFNPNGTNAGLNVGSQAGDPSTPANGDLWYDGTANELTARINGANVALGAGGGSGISTATARANTGWTSDGTTAQDTLAYNFRIDNKLAQFQVVDADNDSVLAIPQSLYPLNYKDATTQLAAVDSLGTFYSATGYDAVGATALTIGSADVPSVTITTDGTGNGEVVLPANSVSGSEMVNDTVTPTQVDESLSFTWTADQRFNRATYFAADGDTLKHDLRTQLYPLDLEIGDVRKWAVDSTGSSTQTGTMAAVTVTENGNAVPNATDHLGFFAATTSSQLAGVVSDETGSGAAVFGTSPSLTTPSISGSVAMASGSAFNFNSGDVTVTHSADALTVAGGDVVVPTEVYDATGWNGDNSVPTKDAVRDKIETISGGSSFDPSTTYERFEDWEAGTSSTSGSMGSDWIRVITTSGTTSKEAGEAGAPGIMRLFCANSAGSTASLHTDADTYILNGPYVVKARVRFSTLGTAGSNGAYYRVGFMDDMVAAIPTDGAWIEFNVDSSATRWRAVTANGGTRTITTYTGSTVSAATWYKLTITPNSDATSIVFAVDGTTIATHTTNIPTGAVGLSLVSAAVTASTTKFMSNDYIWIKNSSMSR